MRQLLYRFYVVTRSKPKIVGMTTAKRKVEC